MRPLPCAPKPLAPKSLAPKAFAFMAGLAFSLSAASAAETTAEQPAAPAVEAEKTETASLQPTSAPPLLMRTRDGSYVKADETALPKAVVEQPCYQYNNYWCLKGTRWEGQEKVGEQRLAVFHDPIYAARAVAITIHAYRFKHNLRTPREIMTRYILSPDCRKNGPSGEKCTRMWELVDKYAHRIGAALGIGPNEPLKVFTSQNTVNLERARTLFREMAHIEIGQTLRVPDELIDKGLERAGFKEG